MKLADIEDRQGLVTTTPYKYILAAARTPPIDMSDETAETYIDGELADLKTLILAKRAALQEAEEAYATKCYEEDEPD
jgi:hypothetical protein